MALHGNNSVNNFGRFVMVGGINSFQPGNRFKGGERFNWIRQHKASTVLAYSAWPAGYYPPATYYMPLIDGELSSRLTGSGTISSSNLAGGVNLSAGLTGSGTISNALLALVVSMSASLTGSGTITSADCVGIGNLSSGLTGSGAITSATMTGMGNMTAGLTGTNTFTATVSATGNMSADITASGDVLTTANVADAVLAGIIEAGYDLRDVLALLAARELGESNNGPTSPEYLGLDGVTVRVEAAVDSGGNRTGVTLTPG